MARRGSHRGLAAALLLAVAVTLAGCADDAEGPATALDDDGDSRTVDAGPSSTVATTTSTTSSPPVSPPVEAPPEGWAAAYGAVFGGDSVLAAHMPTALDAPPEPTLRGRDPSAAIIVDRVLHHDGPGAAPQPGPLQAFEVPVADTVAPEQRSVQFAAGDRPFVAVIGGSIRSGYVVADDGRLDAVGPFAEFTDALLAEARDRFVPERYPDDEALLVALVADGDPDIDGTGLGPLGEELVAAME